MSARNNIGFATLKKLKSADGFWAVNNGVEIGKTYMVDLDTIRIEEWMNKPTGKHFKCEVIDAMNENEEYAPFPTELLQIDK